MPDPIDIPAAIQPVRRSATLPANLIPWRKHPLESSQSSEERLFYHPSAKVVLFAPRAVVPIPSSPLPIDFDYPVDTIETLSWRSSTERTVALAPLRIEKVHGWTVFLKCGNVVHAILKNSQCWCVDGESTFVLRIRPLTYYRIELPNATEEDKERIAELKTILARILRYEVTPCPFKRGFTVELPEEAKAPRRKRAWRPKRRESAPAGSECATNEALPEDVLHTEVKECYSNPSSAGEDTDGNTTDDGIFTPVFGSARGADIASVETELLEKSDDGDTKRSEEDVEDVDSQPSTTTLRTRVEPSQGTEEEGEVPLSSSNDSFHSILPSEPLNPEQRSFSTALLPTLPETRPASEAKCQKHPIQITAGGSVVTEVPTRSIAKNYFEEKDSQQRSPVPLGPSKADLEVHEQSRSLLTASTELNPCSLDEADSTIYADSEEACTADMASELHRRMKASRRRDISPMPPASILYQPRDANMGLAFSFIQKTCALVLVPPIQLLLILIHIAAHIMLSPAPKSAIHDVDPNDDAQSEDDFGIPLASSNSSNLRAQLPGELDPWDLD